MLVERLKNTIKENPNDEYVQQNFPNFIKEIEAKPELADDANVQEAFGLTDLSETTDQRLVEYPDGTLDFYTKGTDLQGGMESVQSLIDELGISQEEAFRIKQLEPEDQILEITKLRTLKNKPEKAQGGIISARKGFRGGGMDAGAGSDFGGFSQGDNSPAAGGTTGGTTGGNTGGQGDGPSTPQEINVGNAPQVFDINTVGDPSFNPGSINVSGGNNYTPSFDSKNSFLETLLAKGRNVLSKGRQVYDNPFVRLGLATLLPTNFKDVQTAISALDLGKKAFDNRVEIKDFITNDPLSNIQNLLSQKAINDELNRETTIDGQIQGLNIKDMYKKGGIVGLHI